MDEKQFELAAELEMRHREAALEASRQAPESHPHFDGKHCVECDDEIPQLRLDMGKVRCVNCQSHKERYRVK